MKTIKTIIILSASALASCDGNHVTGLPKRDSAKVQNYGSAGAADTSKKSSSFGTNLGSSATGSDTSTIKK